MFYQIEHIGTAEYFKREQGENFCYPLHLHRSFELILADEGEMTVTVNGTPYVIEPGRAVLIFPNQIHSIQSVKSKHTLFIFSPQIIQSFFVEKTGKIPEQNVFPLSPPLNQALHALTAQSSKYEMKGTLYTACAAFDRLIGFDAVRTDRQDLLFDLFSYIEQNFNRDCSLKAVSGQIGYNADYISRFFRKKLGITYNRYINAKRLSHAAYLLTNSRESCIFCAMESGYTSLRSFNRNFKEEFGVTPQEYRKLFLVRQDFSRDDGR